MFCIQLVNYLLETYIMNDITYDTVNDIDHLMKLPCTSPLKFTEAFWMTTASCAAFYAANVLKINNFRISRTEFFDRRHWTWSCHNDCSILKLLQEATLLKNVLVQTWRDADPNIQRSFHRPLQHPAFQRTIY